MRGRRNVAAGMSAAEAHYEANAVRGLEQVKEIGARTARWLWLEHAVQDLRYAVRACARTGLHRRAVLTLALGSA